SPSSGPGSSEGASSSSRRRRAAAIAARSGVSAQVGLARHESPSRGARLARAAVTLVEHLPHTLAALAAGYLSERRAELVVRATSHLSAQLRAVVDAEVIGANTPAPGDPAGTGCAGWGDRQLERRVRACADRLDPQAAVARAAAAAADRRVTCRPVPDCMALVAALLPVQMAVAVYAALTQAAAAAKAAGDPRSRGQVMADTLFQRVTGQASADEIDIEVQVVITDRALFAGDDTPAHVPGYGPVPAGWVRDLLTRDLHPPGTSRPPGSPTQDPATRDPATPDPEARDTATPDPAMRDPETPDPQARAAKRWLRRLYTHPGTGTLVGLDSTARLFPAGLRRYLIARDGVCRTPWCDAPIRHADHIRPHSRGGPTSASNGQGLCIACNLTKDLPGWHSEVTDPGPGRGGAGPHTTRITTPTGHTHTSTAPPVLPAHQEPAQREPTHHEPTHHEPARGLQSSTPADPDQCPDERPRRDETIRDNDISDITDGDLSPLEQHLADLLAAA
ncbi:MAG: HNH endonuclease, partial [Intrasporangium sp.]|uniref:HNH endonuclease n=1 Tax=Intrasporangium sp. TaxID=1925024 RepID=UPI002647F7CD